MTLAVWRITCLHKGNSHRSLIDPVPHSHHHPDRLTASINSTSQHSLICSSPSYSHHHPDHLTASTNNTSQHSLICSSPSYSHHHLDHLTASVNSTSQHSLICSSQYITTLSDLFLTVLQPPSSHCINRQHIATQSDLFHTVPHRHHHMDHLTASTDSTSQHSLICSTPSHTGTIIWIISLHQQTAHRNTQPH